MRQTRTDAVFLASVVVLSLVGYVGRLGFYSDDWAFFGTYATATDQSLRGLYDFSVSPYHAMRPVQVWLAATLYWAFGLAPIGHHLFNAALLVANALLVYLILHEVRTPRLISLAVASVFALLPNYSSDRFWFIAFAITLSMTATLGAAYADLRAVAAQDMRGIAWKAVAVLAFAVSALAYEVAPPLLLLVPLLMWWRLHQVTPALDAHQIRWLTLLVGIDMALFAGAVAYKIYTNTSTDGGYSLPRLVIYSVARTVRTDIEPDAYGLNLLNALRVHAGTYGLELPMTALEAARLTPLAALPPILGIITLTWAYVWAAARKEPWPSLSTWLMLLPAGALVFLLGYSIFLTSGRVQFTASGIGNRSAIAASVGIALFLVGLAGIAASAMGRHARFVFAVLLAATTGCSALIVNTIADRWAVAYQQELDVLSRIRHRLPTLMPDTTLILDGVCPYVGPAIVFESHWDLAGALQTFYKDRSLSADVVTPRLGIGASGLETHIYGQTVQYAYGPRLVVFNAATGRAQPLTSQDVAREYFASVPRAQCPPGKEGIGVRMF